MENEQTDPASHPQQPSAPVTPRAGSGKAAPSPQPSAPINPRTDSVQAPSHHPSAPITPRTDSVQAPSPHPSAPITPRAGSGQTPSAPLTRSEAEAHWRIHANEILASDADYLAAERIQKHVGKVVGWSYVVLVASLLAFMMGFYLWRFRFFWAICIYVVLLCLAALAARTISVHAMRNDHLGDLVKAAHDRFITRATGS